MSLDSKVEKKIDTVYRNTKQMPLLAGLGVFIPIVLLIGGALGLLYWFWRRDLLRAADSGQLVVNAGSLPPPLSRDISTSAKLDFIREHEHSLLVPLYALVVYLFFLGCLISYVVITSAK